MPQYRMCDRYRTAAQWGFTLIELMMVIAILAVVGLMVVPMLSSAGASRVDAAAKVLACDLEYARNMAITYNADYRVSFYLEDDRQYYQIVDQNDHVITHPVDKDQYIVQMGSGQLTGVRIISADFDGTTAVGFDGLGCPWDGGGDQLNSGSVVLEAAGQRQRVTVEAITGYVRVGQ